MSPPIRSGTVALLARLSDLYVTGVKKCYCAVLTAIVWFGLNGTTSAISASGLVISRGTVVQSQDPSQQTRPRRVNPVNENARSPARPATATNSNKRVRARKSSTRRAASDSSKPNMRQSEPAQKAPAGFTVQLGAFRDEPNARRLSEQLIAKGYRAEITTMTDSRKRAWRLVRVGIYAEEAKAEAAADEILQKTGVKGVIRPSDRF
ncbi:MAG TPA: SPOR domain-containing protein [Blastocatellia bacterium]